jgi:uroporphyrinogen decarboxylase
LEAIVRSTLEFVERLSAAGVDGIFYAIQHASYQYLDEDAYARFGESFDRRVLEAAAALAFNMLHLHGEALIFDLARRLRGPVVNWHSLETGPSLAEGRRRLGSAVCGGLRRRETLALGDPVMVRQEARRSLRSVGGRGVVLGAGCVVPIITPLANLEAAVEAAHDFR